jgi:Flp pilus assembly protein TadG
MKKGIGTQWLFRLACEEHGAELVEFAITGLLLMMVLFGVFAWMFAMYAYDFTTYGAQQGSRFAEVRGYTWSANVGTNCSTSSTNFTIPFDCTASAADIQNYVRSLAPVGINASNITVNSSWPGTTPDGSTTGCTIYANSQGCQVTVTVSYNFNFFPFMNLSALSMSATSEKVILQ